MTGDGDLVVHVAERAVHPVAVLAPRVRRAEARRGVGVEDGHVLEHRRARCFGEERVDLLAEPRARRVVSLGYAENLGAERVDECGAGAFAAVFGVDAVQQRLLDRVPVVVSRN